MSATSISLFDLVSTYSYVSSYYAPWLEFPGSLYLVIVCIYSHVWFLVVDRVYRSCVVIVQEFYTQANLIILDIVDFKVILGMDLLSPYYAVLDCFDETITLVMFSIPSIVWMGSFSHEPMGIISYIWA